MDEIDASGRQMLIDRTPLTRGRLSVFRESTSSDLWFPRLVVTLKKSGTDQVLWEWTSHSEPVCDEEPPPYGEEVMLEQYFELKSPVKSPRGLEAVFWFGAGATPRGRVDGFSVALYLYPRSLDERGIQIGVVDFVDGFDARSVPVYYRVNFPW